MTSGKFRLVVVAHYSPSEGGFCEVALHSSEGHGVGLHLDRHLMRDLSRLVREGCNRLDLWRGSPPKVDAPT